MINNKQRLRWACRRGMLELDLILESYLLERFDQASHDEQNKFIKLLECSDQDLFDWLLKKAEPEDRETKEMITILLNHAHAKV
jgi:antitoxin CptB